MGVKRRTIDIMGLSLVIALILFQLVAQRSVFIDEANLIRNIYEKSWYELLHPLDYEQYCPPLYAWLVQMSTAILGHSELAYRLVSAVAAIITAIGLRRLLHPYMTPMMSLGIAVLLITNPLMLRYFTECKQYGMDVAITVAWLLRIHGSKRRPSTTALVLLGIISPWLSMASVYVIAAVGIADIWRYKYQPKVWITLCYIPLSVASFGLYYWINLRHSIGLEYLEDVHARYFVELLPSSAAELAHDGRLLLDWLAMSGNHTVVSLLCSGWLLIYGGACMYKRAPRLLLSSSLLLMTLWLACGLHLYLWRPRTLLFSQITFYLCAGFAVTRRENSASWQQMISLVCAVVLLVISQNIQPVWRVMEVTDYKRAFAQMTERDLPIYAAASAYPSLYYYRHIKESLDQKSMLEQVSAADLSTIARPCYVLRAPDWPKQAQIWDQTMISLEDAYLLSDGQVDLWLLSEQASDTD